jgi:hypothetical protein
VVIAYIQTVVGTYCAAPGAVGAEYPSYSTSPSVVALSHCVRTVGIKDIDPVLSYFRRTAPLVASGGIRLRHIDATIVLAARILIYIHATGTVVLAPIRDSFIDDSRPLGIAII